MVLSFFLCIYGVKKRATEKIILIKLLFYRLLSIYFLKLITALIFAASVEEMNRTSEYSCIRKEQRFKISASKTVFKIKVV